MRPILTAAFAVSILASGTVFRAGDVDFNHFESKPDIDRLGIASDSSAFVVSIDDTCPALFTFGAEGLAGPDPQPGADAHTLKNADSKDKTNLKLFHESRECEVEPHEFAVSHKSEYDGYRIHVTLDPARSGRKVRAFRRKPGVTDAVISVAFEGLFGTGKPLGDDPSVVPIEKMNEHLKDIGEYKELGDDQFVATIKESPWVFEFAAGPTISDLTDRNYVVSNGNVVRDKNSEDSHKLGVAAFVHVTNFRWSESFTPVSLGFGVSESNELNLFLGPSWRFGEFGKHTGYLTGGINVGPAERLPAGQQEGQPPISENALTNLSTPTDTAAFIGVTFSFFGNAKAALDKNLKDVGGDGAN